MDTPLSLFKKKLTKKNNRLFGITMRNKINKPPMRTPRNIFQLPIFPEPVREFRES